MKDFLGGLVALILLILVEVVILSVISAAITFGWNEIIVDNFDVSTITFKQTLIIVSCLCIIKNLFFKWWMNDKR